MTQGDELARNSDTLAALYLQEPDASLLETLETALPEVELRDAALVALRQEYYDLFCVPVSGVYLPPYESVQRQGRLWGATTHDVAGWFVRAGFNPAHLSVSPVWQGRVIPDHIGYELAFYSTLLESGQEKAALAFQRAHLKPWLIDYGRKVEANAETALYRLLGQLTQLALNPHQ